MPRRIDTYRGLAQVSRLRVLDEVLACPGLALAELSERTGLHENTLRDHVRVLEAEGFIIGEVEHRGTRGRPRVLFSPVSPERMSLVARRRIEDARRHGDLLRQVLPKSTAPSDLHPDAIHQIDALYEHLDEVGLEPDVDEHSLTVGLVPCPFHDMLNENRSVACRVHEGLIRSVLAQADGPVELDRLIPFTTPHSCHAHLRLREQKPQLTE